MAVQIGFFLEFLHVVTIRARIHFPVDVARIVARRVLAILGELHAEAFEGAAVQAAEKAFDDGARAQFHAGNLRENLRIEEAPLGVHIVPIISLLLLLLLLYSYSYPYSYSFLYS